MSGEVIKEFLVGLNFGIDDASLDKFRKALQSASVKVTALYASIQLLAGAAVKQISSISEGFEQMGYEYRIIAPAINKAIVLRREMLKAYSAAGINISQVVLNSVKLNMSLTKTKFALEAIYKSVGSRFFTLLTKQSDLFRQKLYANMPKIQNALERLVKFIFKAFEATTILGTRLWSILTRVYDFFVKLDKATDGWSTIILGVVAAWKLLNLSFLATPLGMIIAGLIAILALFDDFKTWQEGGESMFDWSSFVPVIDTVADALKAMWGVLNSIAEVIGNVVLMFYQLFKGDWTGAIDSLKGAFIALNDVVEGLFNSLGGVLSSVGSLGTWAMKLFGGDGSNAAANIQKAPGVGGTTPIGSQVANSQSNQNVQQQTQINVQAGPNASATAAAVVSSQNSVNRDMVRNLKGATR